MPIIPIPLKRQTTVETPCAAESEQLQAFRDPSTSRRVIIPARFDEKTGKHVILWREIQVMFKDAEHIVLRDTDSDTLVPFLLDDNLEL